jgi:hypothetical protein
LKVSRDFPRTTGGGEEVVRKSGFADRCFAVVILLSLAAFLAGVAYSLIDQEPRRSGFMLMLQTTR